MQYLLKTLLIAAGSLVPTIFNASAQDIPTRVTTENFKDIRSHVLGGDDNQLFLNVAWVDNVLDGQLQAAQEDKPILLWLYFGGPLGNC